MTVKRNDWEIRDPSAADESTVTTNAGLSWS